MGPVGFRADHMGPVRTLGTRMGPAENFGITRDPLGNRTRLLLPRQRRRLSAKDFEIGRQVGPKIGSGGQIGDPFSTRGYVGRAGQ
jgi:hypothetical protein